MKTKKCSKCGEVKPISEFYESKIYKDGHCYWCKNCQAEYIKKNPEKKRECTRKWRRDNPEKARESARKSKRKQLENNPEKVREYDRKRYKNNPEKYIKRTAKYQKDNPEMVKRCHIKFRSNPKNRLSDCISNSIRKSLKGNKNGNHWENLAGYTLEELKLHFESLFKPKMTWDNYGKDKDCWSIDHKIPISLWKFNTPKDREFKQCWALSNLQPLWHKENISKGNRI